MKLSRAEIEREIEETDMTIHPLAVPGRPTREEAAANTYISFRRAELTPAQLVARDAELRAKAPQNPNSHSARAAKAAAERAARRAAAGR